jgi:polysaccharide export outer membrane protein
MKISHSTFLIVTILALMLGSCVTQKELTYLRYSGGVDSKYKADYERMSTLPAEYKIMPYDNLFIRVITPDPQWSELFNTMPIGAGGAVTEESARLFGYPVDNNGKIEIPFVGSVSVGGKTLNELKVQLDSIFKNYVTDAALTIRLINNNISIIGEVSMPGRYQLTKDRVNVFEALAMSGDMSEFANRRKVQLIRPSQYGPIIKEFSLSDRSILSSEYYYVMPNDILYVLPMKGRAFRINSSVWSLFLTTITSALGVIAFFRTL